jgi:hypothetical protein
MRPMKAGGRGSCRATQAFDVRLGSQSQRLDAVDYTIPVSRGAFGGTIHKNARELWHSFCTDFHRWPGETNLLLPSAFDRHDARAADTLLETLEQGANRLPAFKQVVPGRAELGGDRCQSN